MPICVVHITAYQIAKDIFLLYNLFYLKISVKPLKPSGLAQCFSCQQFGHGSRNCRRPPRCVKCAGNHTAQKLSNNPRHAATVVAHTRLISGAAPNSWLKSNRFLHQEPQTPYNQTQPLHQGGPLQNSTLTYSAATSQPAHISSISQVPQLNLSMILNLLTHLMTALSNNQDPKTVIETTIKSFLSIHKMSNLKILF